MEVLISRFMSDSDDNLEQFEDSDMQVAFFQRRVFKDFNHEYFYKRLMEHNIRVRSIHAPAMDVYHQANNEFLNTLEIIKNVYKVKVITIHPQRGEKKQAKNYYRKLEEQIKAMDIILAYETFEKEAMNKKWITQVGEMHEYFDALKMPFLGVTYDFTHSEYHTNVEEVKKYNDKIYVIHLSDALRDKPLDPNEFHQHLPLGYGNYRVLEFIDALIEINYQHFVVLEYHPEYDHLLKNDARVLKKYLAGDKQELIELIEERHKQKCCIDL